MQTNSRLLEEIQILIEATDNSSTSSFTIRPTTFTYDLANKKLITILIETTGAIKNGRLRINNTISTRGFPFKNLLDIGFDGYPIIIEGINFGEIKKVEEKSDEKNTEPVLEKSTPLAVTANSMRSAVSTAAMISAYTSPQAGLALLKGL